MRDAEVAGDELVGVWHSHTHTDAYPSATDVRQAVDPGWIYVLVSLKQAEPSLRAYRIRDDEITEVAVEVPGLLGTTPPEDTPTPPRSLHANRWPASVCVQRTWDQAARRDRARTISAATRGDCASTSDQVNRSTVQPAATSAFWRKRSRRNASRELSAA